jgi:uncharacterized protein YjiS (DUF1127 family)
MQSEFRSPDELTSTILAKYMDKAARSPKASAATNDAWTEEQLTTGELYRRPRLESCRPANGTGDTTDVRLRTMSSEPEAWWCSIPAAMSWLRTFLIDGCAAYGAAMHPGLFEYPEPTLSGHHEQAGHHERVEAPQWRDPIHQQSETLMSSAYGGLCGSTYETELSNSVSQAHRDWQTASASANPEDSVQWEPPPIEARHWYASFTSPLASFWSRMCRERRTRLMIRGLEDLDDRTLRDIGIYRCEIEYFARLEDYDVGYDDGRPRFR